MGVGGLTLPTRAVMRERFEREWPQVLRILIAGGVAYGLCQLFDPDDPPTFAIIVPLLAMRDHPFSALNVSFDRILGVIGGVFLGVVAFELLGPGALAMGIVVAVGLFTGVFLRLGIPLNIQIALSGLLVFVSGDPEQYAWTRLWETLVGASVTVLLAPFLFPPDAAREYRTAFARVTQELAQQIAQAADLVPDAPRNRTALSGLFAQTRATQERAHGLPASLASARTAVANNPLRRRDREPLAAMVASTEDLVELGRWVRVLLEELVDFTRRSDIEEIWPTSGTALAGVLRRVAAALDPTLVPDALTGEQATLAGAAIELRRWREEDKHPVAIILRRPTYRLIRASADFVDEEVAPIIGTFEEHAIPDALLTYRVEPPVAPGNASPGESGRTGGGVSPPS
jgi:uncharacterized membrane protein YgaE (UPF0421/DUF939 family)